MSTRILGRIACIAIGLGIGVVGMPSSANANMRLELASGGQGTILTDTLNTGVLTTGLVSMGGFNVNVSTGTSSPPLAPPPGVIAQLDLNSVNISSTGGGTLTIILENSGYSSPNEALAAVGLIGGTITNGSVTATAYVNSTNAVPALGADQGVGSLSGPPPMPGSGLQALSFASSGGAFSGGGATAFASPGTFSMYEEFVVTFGAGGGTFSADASEIVVPEPSSLAVAGLGALGMIGYGLRRRKASGA